MKTWVPRHVSRLLLVVLLATPVYAAPSGEEPEPQLDPLSRAPLDPSVSSAYTPRGGEAASALPSKYPPDATAMLLNYCRESLFRIAEFNDRTVLDEEYGKLVNNVDVTRIQDDEIAEIFKLFLTELDALKLNADEKERIVAAYNRQIQSSVLQYFRPGKGIQDLKSAGIPVGGNSPAALACKGILIVASGIANYKSSVTKLQQEAGARIAALTGEELKRLTTLRTQFFDTEYRIYKRYGLSDRLNLKEVQLEQYLKVLADEDSHRRLERLDRLKDDFAAFPPFWYQLGRAAQESGNRSLALAHYAHFEQVYTRVFREDPDYVMLCMHRVLLWDPQRDRGAIVRDLQTIERHTKYYYKWESVLFAALTYYQIGDLENARRLIQTSIHEGYNVPFHEEIRTKMESEAARDALRHTARDLFAKTDAVAVEALRRVGPAQRIEVLRMLGPRVTGIAFSVKPRSHAAQHASYAVPVYNLYSIGRSVLKGDAYNDNVIAHVPMEWFRGDQPKITLSFLGRSFKPVARWRNKELDTMELEFSRVFEQDDVVKRKMSRQLRLRIEALETTLDFTYDVKPVTAEMITVRPELSLDTPFFDLMTIEYAGDRFRIDGGLVVSAP